MDKLIFRPKSPKWKEETLKGLKNRVTNNMSKEYKMMIEYSSEATMRMCSKEDHTFLKAY